MKNIKGIPHRIVEATEDMNLMFDEGMEEAAFGDMRDRALLAFDLFNYDYDCYLSFIDGMSDGFFDSETIQDMEQVEHRLLDLAARIRAKRFDAIQKRIQGDDYVI